MNGPNVRFCAKADIGCPFRRIGSPAGSAYYFFIIIIVIRHETTAAGRWLLLIVRALFNDALTVAVWTGFHVCPPRLRPIFAAGAKVKRPCNTTASEHPPGFRALGISRRSLEDELEAMLRQNKLKVLSS
jgi:hypothetical protein